MNDTSSQHRHQNLPILGMGTGVRTEGIRAALQKGHFAEKQIFGRNPIISWSHKRRFRVAFDLARPFAGKKVLDYGCGDATFLALLMEGRCPPGLAVGAERDPRVVEDCRERFAEVPALSFIALGGPEQAEHRYRYDAVFCMEVLEHALDVDAVLRDLDHFLAPSGTLIVSVPVEMGIPLVIKQTGRRLAGLQGIGGYVRHSGYSWREMMTAVFAGARTEVPRIIHTEADGRGFYDHKGFNWMAMRDRISARFGLQQTLGSPFRWLTPHLSSQAWLIARKRP